MATIQSQLRLNDGMSTVLRQVTAALDMCLASYEQVQATSRQAMDMSGITAARVGLSEANAVIDDMAAGLRQVENQQNGVNRTVRAGTSAFDGMLSKIGQMAAVYLSIQGLQKISNLSDNMASAQARLSLIVDDGGSVENLEAKIYASAQRSRGSYMSVLNTVSKLGITAGDAFNGNDEMIRFAELMNQNFIIAGASATEQTSAMYQLTQAMAAGRLQGDEYRSIIENAPLLANSIEDYMRNVQGATGSMKDWASEGMLTADVIKAALFSASDEIEDRFAEMPMTWAQVWTGMGNTAILVLQPLLTYLNNLANDPRAQGMVNGLLGALNALVVVAVPLISFMVDGATLIAENWNMIAPIMLGLAAAWAVYTIAVNWDTISAQANALWTGVITAKKIAATAATWIFTGATLAQAGAQHGLNAALYACPLVWILIIIIAVIAAIYLVIAAINNVTGSTISATGIIAGAFMVAFAFIGNIFIALWNLVVDVFVLIYNLIAEVANFVGNVFTDPIGAVARLFFGLADTVLGVLQTLAGAVDAVFGTNLASGVQGWRDSLGGWVDDTFGQGTEIMAKMNADDLKLGRFEYGAAWDIGYNAGANLEQDLGGMFDISEITNPNGSLLDGMGSNLSDIANNTGSTAASVKTMSEDFAYYRDIAEREAINRFTTSEIKVDMTGMTNRIDSGMDIDGVISKFTDGVREALVTSAEGVHK